MIIAIEGIDASGKETQARLLKRWAIEHGKQYGILDVSDQDFPDYTNVTGAAIGKILAGEWTIITKDPAEKEHARALTLQSHMIANRLEHGSKLKYYGQSKTSLLILDRFNASAMVYGASDGLDPNFLTKIHLLLPQPILWVLLDISVDESFRRRPEREDYYERNKGKLEDVRARYLDLFAQKDLVGTEKWVVINAERDVFDVHREITKVVQKAILSIP